MADSPIGPPPSPRCGESQGPLTSGLTIAFFILSFSSVVLRLFTRYKILHIFGPDDIAITVAQLFSFGVTLTTVIQVVHGGMGKHSECVTFPEGQVGLKGLLSNLLVYNAAQLFTKISFLLQYRRLFPAVQKICTYGIIALSVYGVAQSIYTGFACIPLSLLNPSWVGRCIDNDIVVNLSGSWNVITDFAIFAIPVRPILQLQMSKKQKAQLLGVFCLGFFACAISILRLQQVNSVKYSPDPVWTAAPTSYWSAIELNIGILCACIPTLRPLLKKIAPGIMGSTQQTNNKYSHKLSTVPVSRNARQDNESGIYIQKEVEFQSTTELRSKESAKNPFSVRGESLDEISDPDIQVTSKARGGK